MDHKTRGGEGESHWQCSNQSICEGPFGFYTAFCLPDFNFSMLALVKVGLDSRIISRL